MVEIDGIGINSTTIGEEDNLDYSFNPSASSQNSMENWEIFNRTAGRIFSIPKMYSNPFSNYFEGVFAYSTVPEEESNISIQQRYKKAAKLLNSASKKHYLRATHFMRQQDLGYVLDLDAEELQRREEMDVGLHQVIIDYVKSINYPRHTKIEDIDTLESMLDLLPGDTEVYRATYKHWVEELTALLKSSRSTPSGWVKNLSTLTITAFAANVLLASAGNSLSSWSVDHMVAPAILGMTQAASSITSVVVGGITTPWIRNLWSSLSFYDREGNFQWSPTKIFLLKDDLTLAQITDSARLVILYGLLYNAEKVKNRIDLKSDQSKAYIRKLHNLILSCDYQLTHTLSNVILMKEQQEFKY
ncbi:hypothetical protein [Candidatus Odyssella acanthamoebae]|uniref:Uncharacterized protein n=1 Tax=Candidatus Odyssella acanthamoebae TaxID=91604 RepID=A0A077AVF7_9PROT|nr:hypothetical protein [Candidatus Paracaedibacter acanthamoebae]AIK96019.1 hypothetical protein ID47_03585 [Candidatus Paracaedibacter acanthamoebae]